MLASPGGQITPGGSPRVIMGGDHYHAFCEVAEVLRLMLSLHALSMLLQPARVLLWLQHAPPL